MSVSLNAWLRRNGAEEAFATLANLVPNALVFVVDRERSVILWNDEAERVLQFSRDEVLGSHCLKGVRCERCMTGCGLSEHRQIRDVPVTLYRADGAQVRLRKWASAMLDDEGRFSGGIEVLVPEADEPRCAVAAPAADELNFHGLISRDPNMLGAIQTIRNVAETDATVLIRGESGTGKELVARAIHDESHRRDGPFVTLNCATLSPTLLESELFGHVRGSFTGAVADRVGLFTAAHKGTIFLDEVAEIPLELQAKLLRVLQDRTVLPVGAIKSRPVDVRVVSATHRSLRAEVKAGRFREDLMFRLRVVPVFLPPLRERRGDIELLLNHFIARNNKVGPRQVRTVAPEAMKRLLDHPWPGNVRELQNVVDYVFAVGRGPEIALSDLPPEFREQPRAVATPDDPTPAEGADAIRQALDAEGGHVGRAAARLGVSRPTFWRMRKRFNI